jgi:hypothetical protein
MKLERRKFKYQGYYNSAQGYPVPCECVLEYVEPLEVEMLEAKVFDLEKRVDALQKVLSDVADFANAHDLPYLEDILRQETEVSQ